MDKILIWEVSGARHITAASEFLWPGEIEVTDDKEKFRAFEGLKFLTTKFGIGSRMHMHTNEFISQCRYATKYGGKVVLDYSLEADTAYRPGLILFLEMYKEASLPFDKLFLAYNNSYDIFRKKVSVRGFTLNTVHFPYGMISTYMELSKFYKPIFQKYDYSVAKKDFLMLNRRLSSHKFDTLHELVERNWHTRSNLTAVSVRQDVKGTIRNNNNDDWARTLNKLNLELSKDEYHLYTPFKTPLQLEDDYEYGIEIAEPKYLYTVNPKWYEESKINIVQETWYEDYIGPFESFDKMIHITEKTWKAIALNCPFVVVGNRNLVKRLHDYDIRTDFIRSSHYYDDHNDDSRRKAALDYADSMSEYYDSEHMREVALHNYGIFWNIDNHRNFIKKHFYDQLFYGDINYERSKPAVLI